MLPDVSFESEHCYCIFQCVPYWAGFGKIMNL